MVLIYFLSVHSEHEHGQEIETVGPWPIGHVQPSPTKRIGSISPFSHRLTKVARKLAAGRLTPDANGVGHTATPDTTPHGHASGANPHSRAGDSAKAKEIWITGKKNASVDFFFLFFFEQTSVDFGVLVGKIRRRGVEPRELADGRLTRLLFALRCPLCMPPHETRRPPRR